MNLNRLEIVNSVILAGALLALIIFQLPQLPLAHFWDEAWVYAPAIRTMAEGMPSLLPDAIPLDISRGHPLLMQFLGGWWLKIFGDSNSAAHSFALFIACITVVVTWDLVRKSFGAATATGATLLMMAQPIFMTQSTMIYPEMLMTLGLVMAVFGYARDRFWLFGLGLSIALYAKESAIVFLIAFLLWEALQTVFLKSGAGWKRWTKFILPLAAFASHPLLQYLWHGWFFYPEHTGYINTELNDLRYNIRLVYDFIFREQARPEIFVPMLLVAAVSLALKRTWWNALLIIVGFAAFKVLIWKWAVPASIFPFVMLALCALPLLIWFFKARSRELRPEHHVIGLTYIITIGFIVFSAMNFFTLRYTFSIIFLLTIALGVAFWRVSWLHPVLKYGFTAFGVIVLLLYAVDHRSTGDVDLGMYDDVRVQQKMVDFFTTKLDRDHLVCTNYVTFVYLQNPLAGYVTAERAFGAGGPSVCAGPCDTEYIIATNTAGCDQSNLEVQGYDLVYSDTLNASFARIYRKQHPSTD